MTPADCCGLGNVRAAFLVRVRAGVLALCGHHATHHRDYIARQGYDVEPL